MSVFSSWFRARKRAGIPGLTPGRQGPSAAVGAAYTVHEDDRVHRIADIPQSSVGAPLPCVVSSECRLAIAYLTEVRDENWDGSTIRAVSPQSENLGICVVRFEHPRCHFLGPPNDEAFNGHPLAARGLEPYGSFTVAPSSWIRALEAMNSVHPYHKPSAFQGLRHYVLSFHDSTFECVAAGHRSESRVGSLRDVVMELGRDV